MEDIQRPTPKEFFVTKEVGAYDEHMTTNMVLGEVVAAIKEHFGIINTPAQEATDDQEATPQTIGLRVVCMTPEEFEEYQELAQKVTDLEMELDSLTDESVIDDEDQSPDA